jgi:hypothetical protein
MLRICSCNWKVKSTNTIQLSAYEIQMAYWENEKYLFPESMRNELEPKMSELESHQQEIESCIGGLRYATTRKFSAIDEYNNGLIDNDTYRERLRLAELQLQKCIEIIIGFIQF